eukprot:11138664-Alexandrium_andersonii.AAC.1
MDEAAVPAGPAGRNVLVHCSESAENGDPLSCSSVRQARRPRRVAPKPRGPRFPPIRSPGQGRFA